MHSSINKGNLTQSVRRHMLPLKDSISSPNILVGNYSFYESPEAYPAAEDFLKNVLNHADDAPETLTIGKFCAISSGVKFNMSAGARHSERVSAFPFSMLGDIWSHKANEGAEPIQHIHIGNDVSIGYESVIMPGVSIGDGAIINTRAVVTKDVAPYAVVGGNPAHVLRMRFPEYIVERLLELKWWNWNEEKIMANLHLICSGNVQRLLETNG